MPFIETDSSGGTVKIIPNQPPTYITPEGKTTTYTKTTTSNTQPKTTVTQIDEEDAVVFNPQLQHQLEQQGYDISAKLQQQDTQRINDIVNQNLESSIINKQINLNPNSRVLVTYEMQTGDIKTVNTKVQSLADFQDKYNVRITKITGLSGNIFYNVPTTNEYISEWEKVQRSEYKESGVPSWYKKVVDLPDSMKKFESQNLITESEFEKISYESSIGLLTEKEAKDKIENLMKSRMNYNWYYNFAEYQIKNKKGEVIATKTFAELKKSEPALYLKATAEGGYVPEYNFLKWKDERKQEYYNQGLGGWYEAKQFSKAFISIFSGDTWGAAYGGTLKEHLAKSEYEDVQDIQQGRWYEPWIGTQLPYYQNVVIPYVTAGALTGFFRAGSIGLMAKGTALTASGKILTGKLISYSPYILTGVGLGAMSARVSSTIAFEQHGLVPKGRSVAEGFNLGLQIASASAGAWWASRPETIQAYMGVKTKFSNAFNQAKNQYFKPFKTLDFMQGKMNQFAMKGAEARLQRLQVNQMENITIRGQLSKFMPGYNKISNIIGQVKARFPIRWRSSVTLYPESFEEFGYETHYNMPRGGWSKTPYESVIGKKPQFYEYPYYEGYVPTKHEIFFAREFGRFYKISPVPYEKFPQRQGFKINTKPTDAFEEFYPKNKYYEKFVFNEKVETTFFKKIITEEGIYLEYTQKSVVKQPANKVVKTVLKGTGRIFQPMQKGYYNVAFAKGNKPVYIRANEGYDVFVGKIKSTGWVKERGIYSESRIAMPKEVGYNTELGKIVYQNAKGEFYIYATKGITTDPYENIISYGVGKTSELYTYKYYSDILTVSQQASRTVFKTEYGAGIIKTKGIIKDFTESFKGTIEGTRYSGGLGTIFDKPLVQMPSHMQLPKSVVTMRSGSFISSLSKQNILSLQNTVKATPTTSKALTVIPVKTTAISPFVLVSFAPFSNAILKNININKSIVNNISKTINKSINKTVTKPLFKEINFQTTKNIIKPISKSVNKPIIKEVSKVITKNISKSINKSITKSITKPITREITKPVTKSITKSIAKTIARSTTKPIIKTITGKGINDFTPNFSPVIVFPPLQPEPPYTPKEIILPENENEIITNKTQGGYNVYIKDRVFVHGKKKYAEKFIKANKKPLTEQDALTLGGNAVDNSASATFYIKPTNKPAKKSKLSLINWNLISGKFYKKDNKYVESNIFRIDTGGEISGISALGWIANQNKISKTPVIKTKKITINKQPVKDFNYDFGNFNINMNNIFNRRMI